jgi:hypothetical protein
VRAVEGNAQKGGNGVIVKRIMCLAAAAVVAVLLAAPGALAQQYDAAPGDDDPYLPEQNVVVVGHDELQQIAGRPLPQQQPAEPVPVPDDEATLAQTGGPAVLLPVAAVLLGSGVLAAYAVLLRRAKGGGGAR